MSVTHLNCTPNLVRATARGFGHQVALRSYGLLGSYHSLDFRSAAVSFKVILEAGTVYELLRAVHTSRLWEVWFD